MREKIAQRIDKLRTERERVVADHTRLSILIAQYDAAIGELDRLLADPDNLPQQNNETE